MRSKQTILTVLLLIMVSSLLKAQTCTALGQNPSTAFPVCGTADFKQETVPLCGSRDIIVPGCEGDGAAYMNRNPFWYQFTCFEAGTLGFLVTPKDLGDDYDWQLFDITGHNPDDVFTDKSLVVTGNWSGTYGATGARSGGSNTIKCASDPIANQNSFSAMPALIKDHVYLLLISHFTDSQSGYSLSFSGGTANITDPTLPGLKSAQINCEANQVIIRLTKKMKCSSLASDGSDFSINSPDVTITSAQAVSCSTGFDMDSIIISLNKSLPPGNYAINIKDGNDENSLLDNCNNALNVGASLPFVVMPKQPTPFDSIAPITCAPQTIELVFNKPIKCNSISDDGSDFSITGTYPVSIDGAYGNCTDDSVSSSIFIHLSQPLMQKGVYTITTKNGLDGNTIVDECGEVTPALQSVEFSVKDTVSAAFDAKLLYGCLQDTIMVSHDGSHEVNNWDWTFSNNIKRKGKTEQVMYDSYGTKDITLIATNGFCSDTSSATVNLDNELKAVFYTSSLACPNDPVEITDTSTGNIISYNWSFGNGNLFYSRNPVPQMYPQSNADKQYNVMLVVENNLHCFDTMSKQIKVVYSCFIAVPSAFTPNGDGINDYLYPLNAYKADNLLFTVYNRLGQVVFRATDWTKKWDGRLNGQLQGSGTYVWTLRYKHRDNGQFFSLQGTTVLIR